MAGRATQDRIERFADRIDAKLRADELSETTMRVATRSKVSRVFEQCGFRRRGPANVRAVEAALADRGVFAHPALGWPTLGWEDTVHLTRTPWNPDGAQRVPLFPKELHLNQFLVANFDLVFPDLTFLDSEREVASGGKIDILARDDDAYVVIELKKDTPSKDLVHNLSGYMADVAAWAKGRRGPKAVRGLVIAGVHDERMAEQLRVLAQADGLAIDWMTYRVEFALERTR